MTKKLKKMVFFCEKIVVAIFSLFSIKQTTVLLDNWSGREFSGDIKIVYEALYQALPKHQFVILLNNKHHEKRRRTRYIRRFSLTYYYYRARSKFYITNYYYINQLNVVTPRRGTEYIVMWHAAGVLKKIGKSILPSSLHRSADIAGKAIHALVVSSDKVVDIYSRDLGVAKEKVYPLGIGRTDFLVNYQFNQRKFIEESGLSKSIRGRKIILYAPTIRDNRSVEFLPDFKKLAEKFKTTHVIILQLHPMQTNFSVPLGLKDFLLIPKTLCSEKLMIMADILITDYSSIIFDFAVLKRPMIFYVPDLDEIKKEKGFYIDFDDNTPGKKVRSESELIEVLSNPEMKRYKALYKTLDSYANPDGHAMERFIETFFKKGV